MNNYHKQHQHQRKNLLTFNYFERLKMFFFFYRTGFSSWRIPRLLLNFLSVSPHMLAHAEERLYQGIHISIDFISSINQIFLDLKNKYYGEYVRIR